MLRKIRRIETGKKKVVNSIENHSVDFQFIDQNNDFVYQVEYDIKGKDVIDYDSINPLSLQSQRVTISRLVRDTKVAKELKKKYDNKCQLCDCQLRSSDGGFLSEAHHIRPYNKTHRGSDTSRNLVILCPNHHAQFDQLFYAIEPYTLIVHSLFSDDDFHMKKIRLEKDHEFGDEYLIYIWNLFRKKKGL